MSGVAAIPAGFFVLLLLTACSGGPAGGGAEGSSSASDIGGGGAASGTPDCTSLVSEFNKLGTGDADFSVSDSDIPYVDASARKKSCAFVNKATDTTVVVFVPTSSITYAAYTKSLAAGGYVDNHDGNWYNPAGPQVGVSDGTDVRAAGLVPPSAEKILGDYIYILYTKH